MKRPASTFLSSFMFLMALGFSVSAHATQVPPSASTLPSAIPTRSSGNNLPLFASAQVAPTGETRFLSLHGKVSPKVDAAAQGGLLDELESVFTQPLYESHGQLLFSYIAQTMGDGQFFLNLVVEPATAADVAFARTFIAEREKMGFHGLSVRFDRVVAIFEVAHLEAGTYVEGEDDPFRQDFELTRSFAFISLRSWKDFTNEYGFALQTKDEGKLTSYLENFVADASEFSRLKNDVLPKANMLAIDPKPYLILENEAAVGPAFEESPFLPFKMFRNCYSPNYENGMCVKN